MILPVEIGRHYHRDLWTATQDQLQRLYMRDPATGGRGIYPAFWFGEEEGRMVPAPPNGIARPGNAEELRERLVQVIPAKDRPTIGVIVIGCARPQRR